MPQTRSGKDAVAGDKHKLNESESQPAAKVQKKGQQGEKKQLTLDESLNGSVFPLLQFGHGHGHT